jgi:beta-glucosidase
MKKLLCAVPMFLALAGMAADSPIYHDGWIDLNKNGRKDVYEDPSQPIEKRVNDLLGRMTFDEKVGQLYQGHREKDAEKVFGDQLRAGKISSFLDGSELIETPQPRNRLQHIAVENSRLGIPLIFGHDSIHGFRTIFPIPLAQACAWDPDLFIRTESISARETASVGIDWSFAPMVDLARDPRWGRIAEGFGEDPWLGSLYAAACVHGFQGANPAAPDRVIACLKHYVGYGATEAGRDYNTTEISEYTLRNFYLPQFKAGVDAGAWTVMSAFNCLSGMPASGNRHTLTDILRHEWKFPGFVISDWTSVEELINQGVAANHVEAARIGLTAGVDMEMVSTNYTTTLKAQVQAGLIKQSVVDEAARRVLRVKFARGLFDHPYVDETLYKNAFLRPDALALAREAAARCCVLLKNEKSILPISTNVHSIALIGPLGNDGQELVGCWQARVHPEDPVSLADGIRSKLPAGTELTILRGCALTEDGKVRRRLGDYAPIVEAPDNTNEIPAAAAAAARADVVIMALGEPREWSGEDDARLDITVTGKQQELFDAVVATGKPVIVVLFNGRPLAIPRIAEKAAAILEAWHPGDQGGPGVADVLFGDASPSGRLTTSFPRSVGQIPVHYNHYNTGRPLLGNYVDGLRTPQYPFGYGLAYTTFQWGSVKISSHTIAPGGSITATVNIKNTGSRPGTEVAQLYIRALAGSAGPRPIRELKGYQRISLKPGDSRDVALTLADKELGYYDTSGHWLVEPGKYQIWLTKDAVSAEPIDFELTAKK